MPASVLSGCRGLSAPREAMGPLFASGLRTSKRLLSAQFSPGKASSLHISSLWLVSYHYYSEHELGPQVLRCLLLYVTSHYWGEKMNPTPRQHHNELSYMQNLLLSNVLEKSMVSNNTSQQHASL